MKNNKKRAARVKQTRSLLARNPRKPKVAPPAGMALGGPRPIENPSAGVQRVVDTVDLLYRRGQIDARQRQAADLYRDAWYASQTGIPCSIDVDRVPNSGGAPSCSPTEAQMRAAETLGRAGPVLGAAGSRIVVIVVCWGETIDLAAQRIYGAKNEGGARRSDAEFIGRSLREALTALADLWVPHGKPKMRATRKPDDTPRPPTPARVKRGRVVHVTRDCVFDI